MFLLLTMFSYSLAAGVLIGEVAENPVYCVDGHLGWVCSCADDVQHVQIGRATCPAPEAVASKTHEVRDLSIHHVVQGAN